MNLTGYILLCSLLLIVTAVPIWFAIRVKRHPEKDRSMRNVIAEHRGAEYEAGMQNFLMVNYLSTAFAWLVAAVLQLLFGMEQVSSMLIPGCVLCLVLVIAKWRFTGEFSKAGAVTFAVGLMVTVVYLIVKK